MQQQNGEALIFIGEEWSKLRFHKLEAGSLVLSSKFHVEEAETGHFAEGADYLLDPASGRIRRVAGSKIPDWAENPSEQMRLPRSIDHLAVPGIHNRKYTTYAHYRYDGGQNELYSDVLRKINTANGLMPADILAEKMRRSGRIRYVVFGDSISTGAETVKPEDAYFNRFALYLETSRPGMEVEVIKLARGGENSIGGLSRIQEVVAVKPDLVTIAYGMNDQNLREPASTAVPVEKYIDNITKMIEAMQPGGAQIILVTAVPPNPAWKYASGADRQYAEALVGLGRNLGLPVADMNSLSYEELKAGKTIETLLISNINHPGEYGHQLYYQALRSVAPE